MKSHLSAGQFRRNRRTGSRGERSKGAGPITRRALPGVRQPLHHAPMLRKLTRPPACLAAPRPPLCSAVTVVAGAVPTASGPPARTTTSAHASSMVDPAAQPVTGTFETARVGTPEVRLRGACGVRVPAACCLRSHRGAADQRGVLRRRMWGRQGRNGLGWPAAQGAAWHCACAARSCCACKGPRFFADSIHNKCRSPALSLQDSMLDPDLHDTFGAHPSYGLPTVRRHRQTSSSGSAAGVAGDSSASLTSSRSGGGAAATTSQIGGAVADGWRLPPGAPRRPPLPPGGASAAIASAAPSAAAALPPVLAAAAAAAAGATVGAAPSGGTQQQAAAAMAAQQQAAAQQAVAPHHPTVYHPHRSPVPTSAVEASPIGHALMLDPTTVPGQHSITVHDPQVCVCVYVLFANAWHVMCVSLRWLLHSVVAISGQADLLPPRWSTLLARPRRRCAPRLPFLRR